MNTPRTPRRHLIAAVAAALFLPLHAWATAPAGATPERLNMQGLRAMSDSDLGRVSAQGLTDDLLHQSMDNDGSAGASGFKTIDKLGSTLNTRTNFLDAETTMTDVVYDPARTKSIVTPDGSVLQVLPRSIGELSFDNIRIKGDPAGKSFGSISIKRIEFGSTSLTLTPRH